jgi:ubiquinol-cytochrome c reductase cytochrome c1 subunit
VLLLSVAWLIKNPVAEPEMEERKEMGIRVLLFVAGMALLFYLSKRKLWKKVKA